MAENFLELYKEFEEAVYAAKHQTVLEYEGEVEKEKGERVRILRQVRNFLQHHADAKRFVTAGPDGNAFMKKETLELKKLCVTAGKLAKKVPPIGPKTTGREVLEMMSKYDLHWYPVVNEEKELIGMISYRDCFRFTIAMKNIGSLFLRAAAGAIVDAADCTVRSDRLCKGKAEDLEPIVVNEKGKYVGVIVTD